MNLIKPILCIIIAIGMVLNTSFLGTPSLYSKGQTIPTSTILKKDPNLGGNPIFDEFPLDDFDFDDDDFDFDDEPDAGEIPDEDDDFDFDDEPDAGEIPGEDDDFDFDDEPDAGEIPDEDDDFDFDDEPDAGEIPGDDDDFDFDDEPDAGEIPGDDDDFDFDDEPDAGELPGEDDNIDFDDEPDAGEIPGEDDEAPGEVDAPDGDNNIGPVLTVGSLPSSMPSVLRSAFSKYINVFGVNVIGTSSVSDSKIIHAATVMAEYLDNNEDGQPDSITLVDKLVGQNATLLLGSNESQTDNLDFDALERAGYTALQALFDDETRPGGSGPEGFDATLEEVLHLISSRGVALVYPDVFGETPGSRLADAMDKARGGRFMSPPSAYPSDSWYHYDDETCDYGCMVTEYFYWALTSILGAQDYPGRAEEISNEWEANTRALVQSNDPDVYSLLTDSAYNLPTVLPDGIYNPGSPGEVPGDDNNPDEGNLPEEGEVPDDGNEPEEPAPLPEEPDDTDTPEEEAPMPDEDEDVVDIPGENPVEEDEEFDRGDPQFHILPVGEPLTEGPLAGAIPFAEGWFYSPWFGVFSMDSSRTDPNWVYHIQLGWIYLSDGSAENAWIWSENLELGWFWTNRNFISLKDDSMGWSAANLYRSTDSAWLYYMPDENRESRRHQGNLLYNYNTGQWQSIE